MQQNCPPLLDGISATLGTASNIIVSWTGKMAYMTSDGLLMGTAIYLACQITVTSELLHEVNKFLLAHVILFSHGNFLRHFVCLRKRTLL